MRAAVNLRWGRFIGALLLALAFVVLSSAAPAWARPTDPEDPIRSVCAATDGTADYQYLPVERWSGATQKLHVRSGGGVGIDLAPFQREFQGGAFAVGDFFYSVTTKFVTWSTEFCPLQSVGLTIDQAVARFGDSVLQSPLLAGIVGLAVIGLLLRGVRRDTGWLPRLIVKMIIVAILVMMIMGARNSSTDSAGGYAPGEGSPGWFATMIDQAITEIAAAPAAALDTPSAYDTVGVDQDELSCGAYVDALKYGYEASALSKGALIRAKSIPAQTVSNLWQLSGYRAWSVGQFGRDNLNGQNRVACRMLDANAGIPAGLDAFPTDGQDDTLHRSGATRTAVLRLVTDNPSELKVNPRAPAWRPLNRVEQDKAWIAWASCVPREDKLANLKEPAGWHTPRGQGWLLKTDQDKRAQAEAGTSADFDEACFDFFNTDGDKVAAIFDWGDGDGELKKVAGDMPHSIYDFISALHGTNQGASTSALIGYVLSALGVAAVFGTIGVTIMIVKAVAAFMLLSSIFVAIICLLPNADNNRLVQFVKVYVGLSLTAAFAVFILSLITLLTNVILNVIKGFTGPNSDMTLIIGGLAPVMAAIALHFAFHRAGMPSPMTIKGAMAWGGALSGGAGLNAIGTGTQQLVERGQGLLRRRTKGDDEETTGKSSAKLGKRNSELATEQRLHSKAPPSGPAGPTPEEILNDPDSTDEDRRAARRRQLAPGAIRLPAREPDEVDSSAAAATTQAGGVASRVVLGGPESRFDPSRPAEEQERRRTEGLARSAQAFGTTSMRNKKRAGSTYFFEDDVLRAKYPQGIRFSYEACPQFEPYAMKKVVFPDGFSGDRKLDMSIANEIAGLKEQPPNTIWHHHEDTQTMLLLDKKLHAAVGHSGGRHVIKNRMRRDGTSS